MGNTKALVVRFRAQWIPVLAEWLSPEPLERAEYRSVQIEPGGAGGVDLVASDAHSMLWIHDAQGEANEVFYLDAPEPLVRVCRELQAPPLIDVNGIPPSITMPSWTRPGLVLISPLAWEEKEPERALILVQPLEQPPAANVVPVRSTGFGLYAVQQDINRHRQQPLAWRTVVERPSKETSSLTLNPTFLGRLGSVGALFPSGGWRMTTTGSDGPVIFSSPLTGDGTLAKALVMPMRT